MDYYTKFEDNAFAEIKEKAILMWNAFNFHENYKKEKIDYISHLENIGDNGMTIVAMFDDVNQCLLRALLSDETCTEIGARIKAGGCSDDLNYFL